MSQLQETAATQQRQRAGVFAQTFPVAVDRQEPGIESRGGGFSFYPDPFSCGIDQGPVPHTGRTDPLTGPTAETAVKVTSQFAGEWYLAAGVSLYQGNATSRRVRFVGES